MYGLDKRQSDGRRNTKETLKKLIIPRSHSFRGNSSLVAKIAVSGTAVIFGIALLLICVYVIIPAVISDTAEIIDENFALEMYEETIQETQDDTEQVFEQPDADDVALIVRSCFESVLEENPDIIGRISIDTLDITYLVTQSEDNEYYLTTGL